MRPGRLSHPAPAPQGPTVAGGAAPAASSSCAASLLSSTSSSSLAASSSSESVDAHATCDGRMVMPTSDTPGRSFIAATPPAARLCALSCAHPPAFLSMSQRPRLVVRKQVGQTARGCTSTKGILCKDCWRRARLGIVGAEAGHRTVRGGQEHAVSGRARAHPHQLIALLPAMPPASVSKDSAHANKPLSRLWGPPARYRRPCARPPTPAHRPLTLTVIVSGHVHVTFAPDGFVAYCGRTQALDQRPPPESESCVLIVRQVVAQQGQPPAR